MRKREPFLKVFNGNRAVDLHGSYLDRNDAWTYYTDGSYTDEASMMDRMCGRVRDRAGAAVVGRNSDGEWRGWYLQSGSGEHKSAFTLELMASTMAKVLHGKRPTDDAIIWSDCQGAIQYHDKALSGRARRSDLYTIETTIRRYPKVKLAKVKAHPERYKPEEAWEQNDWGIYLADKLAGGDLQGFERLAGTTPVVVGDSDVLSAIGVVPDVIIAGENGPSLSDPRQLEITLIDTKYKIRRDRYRAEARVPRPPKWELVANQWAARMWSHKLGIGRQAFVTRVLWDKHATGYNKAKGSKVSGTELCLLCGGIETQEHVIRECTHERMACRRSHWEQRIAKEVLSRSRRGDVMAPAMRAYHELALHHIDSYSLWTGMLTGDAQGALAVGMPSPVGVSAAQATSRMARHCGLYAEATADLYKCRQELLDAHLGVVRRTFVRKGPTGRRAEQRESSKPCTKGILRYFKRVPKVVSEGGHAGDTTRLMAGRVDRAGSTCRRQPGSFGGEAPGEVSCRVGVG